MAKQPNSEVASRPIARKSVHQTHCDDCAREAIQIPGGIQPRGYLFVLDASDLSVIALSGRGEAAVGMPAGATIGRQIGQFLLSRKAESLDGILAMRGAGMSVRCLAAAGAADNAWLFHRTAGFVLLEISPRIPAEPSKIVIAPTRNADAPQKNRRPGQFCTRLSCSNNL